MEEEGAIIRETLLNIIKKNKGGSTVDLSITSRKIFENIKRN